MKKILLLIFLAGLSITILAQTDGIGVTDQTSAGWKQQSSKNNFKDSLNTKEGYLKIDNIPVTANGTELSILNGALFSTAEANRLVGVASPIEDQFGAKADTSLLNDTLDLASVAVMKADSSDGTLGHPFYATSDDLINGLALPIEENFLKGINLLATNPIIAQSIGFNMLSGGTTNKDMVDGTIYFIAVYLPEAKTITGVKFGQRTQGIFTADNNNKVGLYSYFGEAITLVASCANDANLFKQTNFTLQTKAFSSTYNAAAGIYFVALLMNHNGAGGETLPNLYAGAASSDQFTGVLIGANNKIYGTLATQADLPAGPTNLSGVTASAGPFIYVALY